MRADSERRYGLCTGARHESGKQHEQCCSDAGCWLPDTDANTDAVSFSDTYSDSDAFSESKPNAHTNSNSFTESDAYSKSECDTDSHANTEFESMLRLMRNEHRRESDRDAGSNSHDQQR